MYVSKSPFPCIQVKADIKQAKEELKADIKTVKDELKVNTWMSGASFVTSLASTLVIIAVCGGGRAAPGGAGPPRQQGA